MKSPENERPRTRPFKELAEPIRADPERRANIERYRKEIEDEMHDFKSENPVEIVREAAREAWDAMGQYTSQSTGADDPTGRATLYMAGFIAGYNQAWSAAFQGGRVFAETVQKLKSQPKCARCGGSGLYRYPGNHEPDDCPACDGKGY